MGARREFGGAEEQWEVYRDNINEVATECAMGTYEEKNEDKPLVE